MSMLPLCSHDRPDTVFALLKTGAVTRARFLGEATALARTLPASGHVINLCRNRYRFTVGLAAALLRGQLSLLPPNDTPLVLEQLASDYPDAFCLTDRPVRTPPCQVLDYPPLQGAETDPSVPSLAANVPAVVLFTSGSTGRPKPSVKSWGNLVAGTRAGGRGLGVGDFPHATVLATVPTQHAFGLESALLLPLQHSLLLHAEHPFFPADIVSLLKAAPRPRILVTTPLHLRALLDDATTLPPVDLVVSATAPLALDLARAAEARFGGILREIYGCSETGQLATRRPVEGPEWTCFDGIHLRQDERGTWASGTPVPEETLLGDIIVLTAGGRFLLQGRAADLVNIAGKRSSLAYLNVHLNAIEGVKDGVFIAPGDNSAGTGRLLAFVVAPGLSVEAILAALRQRIDPAFLPRPLCLVDALPRNALGKLPQAEVARLVALADAS